MSLTLVRVLSCSQFACFTGKFISMESYSKIWQATTIHTRHSTGPSHPMHRMGTLTTQLRLYGNTTELRFKWKLCWSVVAHQHGPEAWTLLDLVQAFTCLLVCVSKVILPPSFQSFLPHTSPSPTLEVPQLVSSSTDTFRVITPFVVSLRTGLLVRINRKFWQCARKIGGPPQTNFTQTFSSEPACRPFGCCHSQGCHRYLPPLVW